MNTAVLRAIRIFALGAGLPLLIQCRAFAQDPWVVYEGREGAGHGKNIVIVTGDDEYRSEESMPQMGKILAMRHGFNVTVLFAIDPATGEIVPSMQNNIPGLEALDRADLAIFFLRFRELPDEQMKRIIDYCDSGKPIIGLRTSTHAFAYQKNKQSPYAKNDWQNKSEKFKGGWGRQVLGETWISHYGQHQKESTRGVAAPGMEKHPILRGCDDIWGPSDVYGITTLSGDSKPLVLGLVLTGMNPTDGEKPGMDRLPVAWTKTWTGAAGKPARVFATTMGHGNDFENEGVRRMLVNACYWGLGMEDKIGAKTNVELVGEYKPTPIGFGTFKKGVKPADHAIRN